MENKKNILLLGSNGFIGKNVFEYLQGKYGIKTPTRYELDLLDKDNVDNYLQGNFFDIVIFAAGKGVSRKEAKQENIFLENRDMFLNLANNPDHFGRIIFLGSGAEYGKQDPVVKIKETDFGKKQPQDEYGRAKYFASEYIATRENIVNLRCFGIFGKYEDYTTRFISNAITRALCGLSIILKQNVKFDYVYVRDLARIIEYFIEHKPKEKFYNIGSGQSVELLELAEIVKTIIGGNIEIKVINPGFNKEYTCNSNRLTSELKDFKFTPFRESINEMVKWYKENINIIDKNKLNFDV